MDGNIEKSNNSSFEDLSNLNENELRDEITPNKDIDETNKSQEVMDIIGNGQLLKKVIFVKVKCSYVNK